MNQAHGFPAFLPWHRAYLLDLERELQAIDPSVTLPYWRFDQAAPNLFTLDFFGVSDPNGTVQFSPANPLHFWVTDGIPGINRSPNFPTNTAPPGLSYRGADTRHRNDIWIFRSMEGNPHGFAHTSFDGSIHRSADSTEGPAVFPAALQRRSPVGEVAEK